MTKNTKIALGCGGAGCLGIILVVIIGAVLIVAGVVKAPGIYSPRSNYNYNYNTNRYSNYNTNLNTNSDSTSSSTLNDDEKHKLFQAAGITQDNVLIMRVLTKIGFPNPTGDEFKKFTSEHFAWATKNYAFIQSVITKEKARAYVEAHIDD
jgi:hypothetical protein